MHACTPPGKRVAVELVVGEKGKELFIEVLRKLESVAKLYDDEGEKALELALDIVNMLYDKEKSTRLRDALYDFVGQLS